MSKIRNVQGGGLVFFCPGCNDTHAINTVTTGRQWQYNGDVDKPTFSPSICYRAGHFIEGESQDKCWCTFEDRHPEFKGRKHPVCYVCHSFVNDGMIWFLDDCTHKLANQTVPIPEWPYGRGEYGGIDEPADQEAS